MFVNRVLGWMQESLSPWRLVMFSEYPEGKSSSLKEESSTQVPSTQCVMVLHVLALRWSTKHSWIPQFPAYSGEIMKRYQHYWWTAEAWGQDKVGWTLTLGEKGGTLGSGSGASMSHLKPSGASCPSAVTGLGNRPVHTFCGL